MRLIAFIIIVCCFLYLYKKYSDAIVYRQFKTKKYFSLKKISIVCLKYNEIQNNFYIESDENVIILKGTYKECMKYLNKNGYEEEVSK